jgi:hypothetical protein
VVKIPVEDFTLEGEAVLQGGAPLAVLCHPHPAFGGRMHTPLVVALAEGLAAAGLSTLRFNFRGLEGSGGTASGGLHEHADVAAALSWARAHTPRVALVGYSFGALMAASAIARGERPACFGAVGFPTTIVGEHADRLEHVDRALAAGVPTLFLHGDADSFCETERVRAWSAGRAHVRIDELAGAGHFFDGPDEADVVARMVRFVTGVLASA